VDNYLTYISELLAAAFLTRPQMLRSSEQVRVDFVLSHGRMEDLIEALTERRVERMSYMGMGDLATDIERELGLNLFGEDATLRRAIRIVENRNLIVHNRGVINARYLRKLPGEGLAVGDPVPLTWDSVMADLNFLAESVREIDGRATEKWQLDNVRLEGETGKGAEDREDFEET
jgi:hypothetical protein